MAVDLSERYLLHDRYWCVSFISVVKKKKSGKKQVMGERSLFQLTIPGYSPPLWGSKGGNFKQLIMSHPQLRADRNGCTRDQLLACPQLSSPTPRQFRTPGLGSGASHSGLGLPPSLKTMSHRHPHRQHQYRQPFAETLILGDSRLCQLDN